MVNTKDIAEKRESLIIEGRLRGFIKGFTEISSKPQFER